MPYFYNEHVNLLFIHIPKTGGTSLELYFSNKFNIKLNNNSLFFYMDEEIKKYNNLIINSSLQHITHKTIIKYADFFNIKKDNLKIITIVRNPYERIVSDLFFFKLITTNNSKEEVYNIIQTYFSENTEKYDNHSICQYLFITDDNKNLINNIHILKTVRKDK